MTGNWEKAFLSAAEVMRVTEGGLAPIGVEILSFTRVALRTTPPTPTEGKSCYKIYTPKFNPIAEDPLEPLK